MAQHRKRHGAMAHQLRAGLRRLIPPFNLLAKQCQPHRLQGSGRGQRAADDDQSVNAFPAVNPRHTVKMCAFHIRKSGEGPGKGLMGHQKGLGNRASRRQPADMINAIL